MDPEKINNVESKENEVSDKEAKTFQKVDPTDIDENYEKNVKIPETEIPLTPQQKIESFKKEIEEAKQIDSSSMSDFTNIFDKCKSEILSGNWISESDYLNNSENGKQIKNITDNITKKLEILKGLKTKILSETDNEVVSYLKSAKLLENLVEQIKQIDSLLIGQERSFDRMILSNGLNKIFEKNLNQEIDKQTKEKLNKEFESNRTIVSDLLKNNVKEDKEYSKEYYEKDKQIIYNMIIKQYPRGEKDFTPEMMGLTEPDTIKSMILNNNRDALSVVLDAEKDVDVVRKKLDDMDLRIYAMNNYKYYIDGNVDNQGRSQNKIIKNWEESKSSIEGELVRYEKILEEKKKSNKVIDVDKFLEKFMEEHRESKKPYITTEKTIVENEAVIVKGDNQIQEVGKFIEISEKNKNDIKSQLDNVIEKGQEIVSFTVIGKADSTGPKDEKMTFPGEQVQNSLKRLADKGFDSSLINTVELPDGKVVPTDDFIKNKDNKDKVNQTWAYARALMQFDFLDEKQLSLIKNSQSLKIKIEAQTVGDKSKEGDQYTGGEVEINTKGNEKIVVTPVEHLPKLDNPPKAIPFRINVKIGNENGTVGEVDFQYNFGTKKFDTMKGFSRYIRIGNGGGTSEGEQISKSYVGDKGQIIIPLNLDSEGKYKDYIKNIPNTPEGLTTLLGKYLTTIDKKIEEEVKNINRLISLSRSREKVAVVKKDQTAEQKEKDYQEYSQKNSDIKLKYLESEKELYKGYIKNIAGMVEFANKEQRNSNGDVKIMTTDGWSRPAVLN